MITPYPVSEPFLEGEADPEIDYFSAIAAFSEKRFVHLTRRVIFRMQRRKAFDVFEGETSKLKNLWAEWRWSNEKHSFESDASLTAIEDIVTEIIAEVVDDIDHETAVLLSCAASSDQEHMPARSDHTIAAVIREMLAEAASQLSVDTYEEDW